MADIATISLRADTSSLEQGDKALDHFGQTAEKTTKQADGLNDAFKAGAQSQKQNNESLKQQQQELQALLTKINPVTAAFSKLDEMESQLAKFKSKDLVDSETFSQASRTIQQTRDELARVAEARTEEGQTAIAQAAADKKATEAKEAFLAKLREQNSLYKASASDSATYRAAQLGVTSEAAPMIAAIRQQEEATRRDAEQKKLAAIAARGLKESIKQLEAEERAATRATKAQEAADISAAAAKENFVQRLREQVELQGKTASEIQAYKAAQMGVTEQAAPFIARLKDQEDAWKKGTVSAGQYRMAMRQLPMQFTDIATSIAGGMPLYMIAIQQGGQIKDSFGGIGNASKALLSLITPMTVGLVGAAAVVGGLALAYYKGAAENEEFNKQLILTGNYAGRTASQLQAMAKGLSGNGLTQSALSAAMAKVVGTGSFDSSQIEMVTLAAAKMEQATGQSIDATVNNFKRLQDEPLKAAKELDDQLHYLTASEYEQISAMERSGNTIGAARVAMESYSKAMRDRADEVVNNVGYMERSWNSLKNTAAGAWDAMLDIGRDKSLDDRLADVNARMAESQANPGRYDNNKLAAEKALLTEEKYQKDVAAARKKANQNAEELEKNSLRIMDGYCDQYATREQQRTKEQQKFNQIAYRFSAEEQARIRSEIDAKYKDRATPKGRTTAAYQDDAATKALLDSQARVAALREQATVTLAMTDQEKQLAKFTQQIADLKSKTILTADQKSLLARSGEITASMQLEAQLSRENVERKKATEALKKMEEYTASIVAKNKQNQDRFGLTSKQAGRVDQETQLDNTFRKDTKGINDAEQLAKITAEYNKAKAELHAGFEQEDLNEGDWLAGMTQGLEQYGETANNVFSATAQLAQTTMGSMTSMATQMMTTGSANVKQFATNFLTSIVDIINRLLIAQAIQAAMGWMSSGASAGAGAVGGAASSASRGAMGMSTSFRAYDVGGYTGDGGKFEPKGVVHGGEFVFTKEATNRIGIDNLYKMMRGYADGGLVSNAVTATAPMLGMQGGGNNITVGIGDVVIMSNSQKENNASNSQDIGAGIQKQLKPAIVATISEQLRIPGSPLWMAMNGNR
ncbi:TPA: phage tail tape measure protein [Yersinia enterocolitica]|nr:phage tail tape measure protein [Yersinia enterocolitica]HDL6613116.1 phage tail tape measure protein [Yersinia enterocolitica]HDM8322176.1 phage tail tape measure protein [Yersinia enterocolitica]HEF7276253.1 phage tail tape measure protein [Yersinia enterocolitica]HEK6330791.1 phage tail tape measure protein [Yersinia enterocolitica]